MSVEEGCGCGCSTVALISESAEPCGCGCDCCEDTAKTKEQEIAELRRLQAAVRRKLEDLGES
jgi:hypothetical protein